MTTPSNTLVGPWEKFKTPKTTTPSEETGPWSKFSLGATPEARASSLGLPEKYAHPEQDQKPTMASHPFYSGIAEGFGFDPEKLHKYGWSEALKEGVQNLGKFQSSVLHDPFKVADAIESAASQTEKGVKEMFHGDTREHGAGLFLSSLAQILGGAEGREKLSSSASRVNGGVKAAAELAKETGADANEAARVANNASHGAPSRFFKRKAFEDQYIHAKGLQIAEKFDKAARAVDAEVKTHAENLSKQIDTAIPSGVIDASAESAVITKEFRELVKTPDKLSPALLQMVQDAKRPPGMWTWEKARQFRSSVGRAMGSVSGPQYAVLTRVYRDLTSKLADVAKKHDLSDSWNQFNKLEKKYDTQFADLVNSVKDAQSGKEVAAKLSKDTALTGETANNLAKYGLDRAEVVKFIKDSKRMLDGQKGWKGTLFRMAYGSPAGVPVMMGVRAAGGGWLPSVAAGALSGYGMSYLTQLARAMKLSPEVIDQVLQERELPGKMKPPTGTFPSEKSPVKETPKLPAPSGGGAPELHKTDVPGGEPESERLIRTGPGTREELPPTDVEVEEAAKRKERKEAEDRVKEQKILKTRAEDAAKAKEPTKVPEGQHGTGKIARQAKARERIDKKRGLAKRTREAETAEGLARAQATEMDTSKLQIPEMEEALGAMEPVAFRALQKARKLGKFAEQDYEPYLREMLLRAYEARGGSK